MQAEFFFSFFVCIQSAITQYETNIMHIIQMAQEQHAIYFGYAFFSRFRQILQKS